MRLELPRANADTHGHHAWARTGSDSPRAEIDLGYGLGMLRAQKRPEALNKESAFRLRSMAEQARWAPRKPLRARACPRRVRVSNHVISASTDLLVSRHNSRTL